MTPRSRTFVVGVVCLFMAGLTNFGIVGIQRIVDEKRADQVRIATLRLSISSLVSDLDRARAGEPYRPVEQKLSEIEDQLAEIPSAGPSIRPGLMVTLRDFRHAVTQEAKAFSSGKRADVDRIAASATRPLHFKLDRTLDIFEAERRHEAEVGTITLAFFATGSFIFVGALIAVLFGLHQRRTMAMLASRSGQAAAEASERRFRSLVRNNADVIAVTNEEGQVKLMSEASERLFGQSSASLIGKSFYDLVHKEDLPLLQGAYAAVWAEPSSTNMVEIRILTAAGGSRPFQVTLNNLSSDPDVQGALLTCHDLYERKRLEDELTHNAFHDLLTGLPNRALFMDRLEHQLRTRSGETPNASVLFIDLDNFKIVNDSLGHAVGDELLLMAAKRLASTVRPGDTVARLGGDEFTILLVGVGNAAEAVKAAQRILASLEAPFLLENREVIVPASIGIAVCNRTGVDAFQLLRDADTAMYAAKAQGKNGFAVFDRRMNAAAMDRLELETQLRQAIDGKQLILHYQPIIDMVTGRLGEVEVLLRWQHPTRGLVAPGKFIPIAEETNLVVPIGEWVLREACAQLARWDRRYRDHRDLGINVNVSGRQLRHPSFVPVLAQILAEHGIEPYRVKLDISETAMLRDFESARDMIEALRATGVKIAIDDFGTSHSTISFLSRLPVDTLKIDGTLIAPLGLDTRSRGVVSAMISMARTLGLQVTSEGIETKEQLDVLRKLGCDSGQGNHFAHPAPADAIDKMLAGPSQPSLLTS